MLVKPIRGPTVETVRLNINVRSKRGVILAQNLAVIHIDVSELHF
jgi:hypothetical protein